MQREHGSRRSHLTFISTQASQAFFRERGRLVLNTVCVETSYCLEHRAWDLLRATGAHMAREDVAPGELDMAILGEVTALDVN